MCKGNLQLQNLFTTNVTSCKHLTYRMFTTYIICLFNFRNLSFLENLFHFHQITWSTINEKIFELYWEKPCWQNLRYLAWDLHANEITEFLMKLIFNINQIYWHKDIIDIIFNKYFCSEMFIFCYHSSFRGYKWGQSRSCNLLIRFYKNQTDSVLYEVLRGH